MLFRSPGLSAAEQAIIARAFAPTLVFHPLEYFPIIPLTQSDVGADSPGPPAAHDFGTPAYRATRYEGLSLDKKVRAAALRYRVFEQTRRRRREVVVEYWCYYVNNADELVERLGRFNLTRREWQEVVGRTPWRFRAFGNVRIEDLIMPVDPPGRFLASMLDRRSRNEQGLLVGFTTVGNLTPAWIVSKRQFRDVHARRAPTSLQKSRRSFRTIAGPAPR